MEDSMNGQRSTTFLLFVIKEFRLHLVYQRTYIQMCVSLYFIMTKKDKYVTFRRHSVFATTFI